MKRFLMGLTMLASACAANAQANGTLDKIKATGTFTVGTREASVPFSYVDDNGKQQGYAWEIAMRVAEEVRKQLNLPGLKVETMNLTPQTRIPLVANQTVDLECSSTTNNLERQKQVSFSTTYFIVGTRLVTRKDSGVHDFSDLSGKPVVVEAGTTSERLLRKLNAEKNWNINILLSKDTVSNFTMVETGRAVASMGDDVIFYSNIQTARNPALWTVVGTPQSHEAYGCMMRKDDPAFKKLVDGVISRMMASGEMERLYVKYFTQPVNVKGGGLIVGAPLSADNLALFKAPNDKALQ